MAKLLITIVLFIGTGVTGFFYLKPQWNTFRDAQRENNYLTAVSAEFDELIKNRDTLLSTINSISKEDLDRIDASLPQAQRAGEFLVTLENIAVETGILLKQLNLSGSSEQAQPQSAGKTPKPIPVRPTPAIQKTISELPSTLSVSGSYDAFKQFLNAVEKNIRLIDIETISFNSPEQPSQAMDIRMKLKTYYQ